MFLLLAGIAEALQDIHATGIFHRDLKPHRGRADRSRDRTC